MTKNIWRHQNCLDVDFEVHRVIYAGPEMILVKVSYISRTGGYLFHGSPDIVKIKRKDLPRWRYMGSSWRADYQEMGTS